MPEVSVSILSLSTFMVREELGKLGDDVTTIHYDIMDGHFVKNIELGFSFLKEVSSCAGRPVECHLMVERPEDWVDRVADSGARTFFFHHEAVCDRDALISRIRGRGMRVGVALSPGTDTQEVRPYLGLIDSVLVMTVLPGFGGQVMIRDCLKKIPELREDNRNIEVCIDGGVSEKNIRDVQEFGPDIVVVGSFFWKSTDRSEIVKRLRGRESRAR
ncbi:MAG: ribulose-5-phosphate-3-epimerase [Amphiamblys sp. WSBS2006]|nr:MAG: ribulose-5-phosphate-3-epimerase [Amphiamblys sp. WSBS2006]